MNDDKDPQTWPALFWRVLNSLWWLACVFLILKGCSK